MAAGVVDFPAHMKTIHQDWLDNTGTDAVTSSMNLSMHAALTTDPHTGMTAYDPTTQLDAMDTAVAAFNSLVDALDYEQDWEDAVAAAAAQVDLVVFDDVYVDADIAAFANNLDDQIDNIVLPRFQGGLRDINAVMSSAFVVGEALIEGMRDRDVAKYGTDLRVKLNFQRNDFVLKGTESMLRDNIARIELEKSVTHYTMEANRIRAVALKEKKDTENVITIDGGKWELEVWQYGANLLAAIGGGTVVPSGGSSPSKTQSAIGGALAGASAGGAIGGGWGALIGGVLGGAAGGGLFG